MKKQPCNRDRVKSRQSYCRIQLENVGSPFFPKYGVKHANNTYREMSHITIYGWFIDFSGHSNGTVYIFTTEFYNMMPISRRNGTVSIQRNCYARVRLFSKTCSPNPRFWRFFVKNWFIICTVVYCISSNQKFTIIINNVKHTSL